MPTISCTSCGAQYRVHANAVGRKARCKRCGETFVVAEPPRDDEPLQLEDLGKLAQGEVTYREAVPVDGPADAVAVPMADYTPEIPEARGSTLTPIPAYLAAVAKSLLFPLKLSNFVVFVFACLCVGLQQFFGLAIALRVSCFFVVTLLLVYGWYMSFLLRTVHEASANEDTLPELSLSGGWVEDIILPLLGAVLSWLVACLPFLIGVISLYAYGQISGIETFMQIFLFTISQNVFVAFEAQFGGGPLLGGLAIAALLLWPMFLLVVAVGGLPCLIRVDLIGIAIARSFPAYLLMSVIAVAGQIAPELLGAAFLPEWDLKSGTYPPLAPYAVLACVVVYFQVVSMRAIGLYYHYFKHRMAWDWG